MADSSALTAYLKKTLIVETPLLASDPVYTSLKTGGGIEAIIEQEAASMGYTVEALPANQAHNLLLLVQRQLYMTLATNVAPEFDVEAEFTKLLKSQRFDHYLKLASFIQKEITRLTSTGEFTFVQQGSINLNSYGTQARSYALSEDQIATLTLGTITSTSIEISWYRFNPELSVFREYNLIVGNGMYDEYAIPKFDYSKTIYSYTFRDIKRTKFRVENLTPKTSYDLALVLVSTNEGRAVDIKSFTTLEG